MRCFFGVGKIDLDRIADSYANEGTGHFVVEGPVFIGAAIGKLTDDFSGIKVYRKRLWATLANWLTDRSGVLRNVQRIAFNTLLRLTYDQFAEHAGRLVARQSTKVLEGAVLVGTKNNGRGCALACDGVGLGAALEIGRTPV